MTMPLRRRSIIASLAVAIALGHLVPAPARAQWSKTYEQFYLPGDYNWQFRRNYPHADRLFNAFDFGHAILYETLWTGFDDSIQELENTWYDKLTKRILLDPPRLPLEEAAIEIAYAKLAPEAKAMFDWAHLMHRQIYDVWADERVPLAEKDAKVAELIRYYKTRPDLAFSSKPKSMTLMQEQPYSVAFRKSYPKFNGLIWAYHWLQVGLYEPLVAGKNVDDRHTGVRAAVARFWQMLEDPPRTMPHVMPMTAAVAPEFAKRYAEAAIIFDNLHSMHDVVSDILANPSVPRHRKRAEILLAARRYRDDTSFVMTEEAWRTMSAHMGLENMGGPAVGFLPPLPTPSVTYGAVMSHDERTGEMTGFRYGQATGGPHAAMRPDSAAGRHAGHEPADSARPAAGSEQQMATMMELLMRLLTDSVIHGRIMGDTAMRRLMDEVIRGMPAEQREHMDSLMREAPAPRAQSPTGRAPSRGATPKRRPVQPSTKPADPHAGHGARPAKPAPPKKAGSMPATKKP